LIKKFVIISCPKKGHFDGIVEFLGPGGEQNSGPV